MIFNLVINKMYLMNEMNNQLVKATVERGKGV